jgi:prophage DNA circulation protein
MAEPTPLDFPSAGFIDPDLLTNPVHSWEANRGCKAWPDVQWDSKFKNIPFAVDTDERSGGRRIHVHEYPAREWWNNEDMGRLRQEVSVQAYVYGDLHDLWAEQVFATCVDSKVGILYLPMRVPVLARCLTVNSTWTADKMGRIDISMRFSLETGRAAGLVPTVQRGAVQLVGQVNKAAQAVTRVSRNAFEEDFTGNQPFVGRVDAANMMRRSSSLLNAASTAARLTAQSATLISFIRTRILKLADDLSTFQQTTPNTLTTTAKVNSQRTTTIPKSATTWVNQGVALRTSTGQVLPATGTPDEGFGGLLQAGMETLARGVLDPSDLAQALASMSKLKPTSLIQSMAGSQSTSALSQYYLSEVVAALTRRLAMAQIALSGTQAAPSHQPDASLSRTRLLATLDDELASSAYSHDVNVAIRDLRSAVVEFIGFWSQGGAATTQVTSKGSQSLAAISANYYGKTDMDQTLMDFNGVRHPLFAPDVISVLK